MGSYQIKSKQEVSDQLSGVPNAGAVCVRTAFIMLLSRAPFPQADIDGAPRLHDTNVYKYNIACQVLCYVLVGTSVLARIYMRIFIKREFKAEDCKFPLNF